MEPVEQTFCPECGTRLARTDGCDNVDVHCPSCGWPEVFEGGLV